MKMWLKKQKFHQLVQSKEPILVVQQPFEQLGEHLERAFSPTYQQHVKDRVRKFHKLSDHEIEFAMVELKKYFILNYLYKRVPMFSDKVDILWHEMLMFTKEYDLFCDNFRGRKIHHIPNVGSSHAVDPNKNYAERVLFEVIYKIVFGVEEESHYFWDKVYLDVPEDFQEICSKYLELNETGFSQTLSSILKVTPPS